MIRYRHAGAVRVVSARLAGVVAGSVAIGLVVVALPDDGARAVGVPTRSSKSSSTTAPVAGPSVPERSGASSSPTTIAAWRLPPPRPEPVAARRPATTPGRPVTSAPRGRTTTSLVGGKTTSTTSTGPRRTTTTTEQPAPPPATLALGVTTIPESVAAAIGKPVVPFGPVADCAHPLVAIDRWPLRAKVAQLVMIGADGNDLLALTTLVRDQQIGGFLIRSAPTTATQLTADLATLADLAGPIPSFVAVDEEGGRVQPLRAVAGSLPSARRLSRSDPAEIRALVGAHSKELRALGVTMVFGPVADVSRSQSGAIGDRSFGGDPLAVADDALAYANGLLDGGLLPVVKHFPGHGSASGDSHVGRVATPDVADIDRTDIPPFQIVMAATPVAVMVGHLEVPGLTGDVPASVSSEAIERELRGVLGFKGLVITDSLSMGAITGRWKAPGAAAEAITAGADVALFVTISLRDAVGVIDALEQIVIDGRLPMGQLNRSVLRVVRSKGLDPCSVEARSLVARRPTVTTPG